MRTPALTAVLVVLLLQPALCAVDTTPYDRLSSQIVQKEAALELAHKQGDLATVVLLNGQLTDLRENMSTPAMQFLAEYQKCTLVTDEMQYLVSQAGQQMPSLSGQLRSGLEASQGAISSVEQLYSGGDYEGALIGIKGLEPALLRQPSDAAYACYTTGIPQVRSDIDRTSSVTPSVVSMLDSAGQRFLEAKALYSQAAENLTGDEVAGAKALLASGRAKADEAFKLLARAKVQGGDPLGDSKIFLIIAPIALVAALLAFFKFQFRKAAIRSYASKDSIKFGKETGVERIIEVMNPEDTPVKAVVRDYPPEGSSPDDFTLEPSKQAGGELAWLLELEPGKRATIAYRAQASGLERGNMLKFKAASVSYDLGGKQKKRSGKQFSVRVV